MTQGNETKLTGKLASIRFHKDDFLIGILSSKTTVKGEMRDPHVGLEYTFSGHWVQDPKYGRQFQFHSHTVKLPTDRIAVSEYLMDSVKWIGPIIAQRLVDKYGKQTLTICKDDPDRVAKEIKGISPKRAQEVSQMLRANEDHEELQVALKQLFRDVKISRRAIAKILDMWGAEAPEKIAENPYALIDLIDGIGFVRADKIARQAGYAEDGEARIQAGLVHVLNEKAFGDGHTYLPREELVGEVVRLLQLDTTNVAPQVDGLVQREKAIAEGDAIYLPKLHAAEVTVARRLRNLATQELSPGNADYEGLAQDQREALQKAVVAGVFVLTGAPGTGKTYTIRRILTSFPKATIALAAPTGKAAKRMSELTGRPALTIHKLLEPRPKSGGGYEFTRDAKNPIDADLLVVDEMSMVDISLMSRLLEAVDSGTRVILVGDTYQLPSVGPGNVLKDLIASGVIESTELTVIKRQDEGLIVHNCHHIKAGEDIELPSGDDADFYFMTREDPSDIQAAVLELVQTRLPKRYDVDPLRDIQVITPLRTRGPLSCKSMNALFQEAMNPNRPVERLPLRVGDKVLQTRNRYDQDILNGDIGFVADIQVKGRVFVVDFENPSRQVEIPATESELELAYAITCHKFQGSEAPIIVVPLHKSMGTFLLVRSWLYTAVSRAQKLCVLVGQRDVVRQAIGRNPQFRRYSKLGERLQ